jgi:small subunit ribosomal protein S21
MSIEIKIRKNEPVDRALRRLKKKLDRENVIKDVRAKRYYEKPCERRRRKNKVMAFTAMLRARYESLFSRPGWRRADRRLPARSRRASLVG